MTTPRRLPTDGGMLGKIYESHYRDFSDWLPLTVRGEVLELGSGNGFLKQVIPSALTSELWYSRGVDLQCSATKLPFTDASLSAILMLDVLHHVKHADQFFSEAQRCLAPGGRILMVEPANTTMSRCIYKHLHHEDFDESSIHWQLPEGDPTQVANGALPWIIFHRDIEQFRARFPQLQLERMEHCLPFSYLLSGGLSKPQLLPKALYPGFARIETLLPKWALRMTAMFYRISITKTLQQAAGPV